jgi:alcohol dehydrogenase class IV
VGKERNRRAQKRRFTRDGLYDEGHTPEVRAWVFGGDRLGGQAAAHEPSDARLLSGERIEEADENTLPEIIIQLMKDVGAPLGIQELGYTEDDIDDLVEGTVKQQRLLVVTPRDTTEKDLARILRESMENW